MIRCQKIIATAVSFVRTQGRGLGQGRRFGQRRFHQGGRVPGSDGPGITDAGRPVAGLRQALTGFFVPKTQRPGSVMPRSLDRATIRFSQNLVSCSYISHWNGAVRRSKLVTRVRSPSGAPLSFFDGSDGAQLGRPSARRGGQPDAVGMLTLVLTARCCIAPRLSGRV